MRVENLERCVAEKIEEINSADKLSEFLNFCSNGNMYVMSPENLMAIYAQKPTATIVNHFDGWKNRGRFPKQNTGIAVYPFNTSGVFGNFTDYIFDVEDTTGRELHLWQATPEIMNRYSVIRNDGKPVEQAREEFFNSKFYDRVLGQIISTDQELWFGENDIEKRWHIHKLLSECVLKIYLTRCGEEYQLSDDAKKIFEYYYVDNSGKIDAALLMKSLKVVQVIAATELLATSKYVIEEKRRLRNEQRSIDGSRGRGDSITDTKEHEEHQRGTGAKDAEPGENRNLPGNESNAQKEVSLGERSNGIPKGVISRTDTITDQQRDVGESSGRESERGEGDVRYASQTNAETTEAGSDEHVAESTGRESNSADDYGGDQDRNSFPTDNVLEGENGNEQLNIFAYMSQSADNNQEVGSIEIEESPKSIISTKRNAFSDEVIDDILVAGPCGYALDAKYIIFNFYSTNWSDIDIDKAVAIIKKQYSGASLGFEINGKEISVFYDDEGLHLAYGKESRIYSSMIVSWDEIEERIYNLIEKCSYIDSSTELYAAQKDLELLSTDLIYFFTDGFSVEKDQLPEPLNQVSRTWPTIQDAVINTLRNTQSANALLESAKEMWNAGERGEIEVGWKYAHQYDRVEHLESYLHGRHKFELPEELDILQPTFIPNDAFDHALGLHSTSTYKVELRRKLYAASEGGTAVDSLSSFMNQEIGQQGSGYSGNDYDHDSRGFRIRLRYDRLAEEVLERTVSNRDMAKRICGLIKKDKFFLRGEAEAYPEWKKNKDEQINAFNLFQQAIEQEKSKMPTNENGYVDYEYLTEEEHSELHHEIGKALIDDERYDGIRNVLQEMLLSNSLSQKEKEDLVHEIIATTREKIYSLKGYDYVLPGASYTSFTRFSSDSLNVHAFPSNYIETSGWVSSANIFSLSVEELTSVWVEVAQERRSEERYTEIDYGIYESILKKYQKMEMYTATEHILSSSSTKEETKTEEQFHVANGETSESPNESGEPRANLAQSDDEKHEDVESESMVEQNEETSAEVIAEKQDFSYGNDWTPNAGNARTRFAKNLEAIKILKQIEAENRYANADEQLILSQYVGWGGLSEFFDESRQDANTELRSELKELLTEEEYKSARATVTDAFYTPRNVIDGIYQALDRFGFKNGNILEPAMGIGNFYSSMPQEMRKQSNLYGVEIDDISGRIAKLLHPNCNIQISGVENAHLASNFFDCVIGNVPFGEFKVNDKKFNKEKFLIHDYFFAKALDLCAPGGIICFVTSKGTLDKKNSSVRKYISERADFLGAIRLPNTTFMESANTEVTSDVIFLRKKYAKSLEEQEFETVELNENNIPLNSYFISNPDMMLGHLEVDTQRYGEDRAISYLVPNDGRELSEEIAEAVNKLPANIFTNTIHEDNEAAEVELESIPADTSVKNYTYTVRDGNVYMRENSRMIAQTQLNVKQKTCVIRLCEIRELLHQIINMQLEGCTAEQLEEKQVKLNELYDDYVKRFGYINDRATKRVFCEDVEYTLLCALEDPVEDGYVKAKIFSQQTIYPQITRDHADTAIEAVNMTVADMGYLDMENVQALYPVPFEDLLRELRGEVYMNPEGADADNPFQGYETKEEYLSGDVRYKLSVAKSAAEQDERYRENVAALENVIPKDLDASEIDVKIGSSWISPEDYQKFMYEKFKIPFYMQRACHLEYNEHINTYFIQSKSNVGTVENNTTYGTKRMGAVDIYENLLNQRQVKVRDRIDNNTYVINQQETMLARAKADLIKEEFAEWLFSDMERRNHYVRLYNDKFNNIRLRDYDGSYMTFPGMNQELEMRPHQSGAVARIIRGGNTLLGHCVGAGKSFVLAAAAMELRRLGLANKPMIVVPNHLTAQMSNEFLQLYPSANILLTTKKDFEKTRRKRFISKIATGDYDCIIIGYSQFEKIPISQERQEAFIQGEIDSVQSFIAEMKDKQNERWSIKQMEALEKQLKTKLELLANTEYKDDVITFEELGVDCLMVDEAHNFKNLSFNTKIGNVAGINPNGSNKAYDMFQKVQYINELTPGRNVIFATGTPISNTMCEMYIMQKYLQPDLLKKKGIYHFDAWAANFGDIVTAMELSPEGKGYREKTRFARFTNLPELVTSFRMIADIKTQDMLPYLKIPKLVDGKCSVVESEPSAEVEACVDEFVERAKNIRNGTVDPSVDNMLKICHDAKFVSTDIRMYIPEAEPDEHGKLYECARNVYDMWQKTTPQLGAQIICSDIGTPNGGKKFSVYEFLKEELIRLGIPAQEICFIHDAKTDKDKFDMFRDVRNGVKRVILGSTNKLGTGANIQTRLCALHEIDVPWRPLDVEQREGRILRQGNMFDQVYIFRYVTKKTFDAYNWSIIENKQRFISQIYSGGDVARSCDDIDEAVLNYAEMAAISSGNPLIKEKMEVDTEISRLQLLKRNFTATKYRLEKEFKEILPEAIDKYERLIAKVEADIELRNSTMGKAETDQLLITDTESMDPEESAKENGTFSMKFQDVEITERKEAGERIRALFRKLPADGSCVEFATYAGFRIAATKVKTIFDSIQTKLVVIGNLRYTVEASFDNDIGNVIRIQNCIKKLDSTKQEYEQKLAESQESLISTQKEYERPFVKEEELAKLLERQQELNSILLESDKKSEEIEVAEDDENIVKLRGKAI